MKAIRHQEADTYEPEKDWKRTSLCNESDISIEHFIKPPLHASPMHHHPNAQVLVVLKGKLGIVTGKRVKKNLVKMLLFIFQVISSTS